MYIVHLDRKELLFFTPYLLWFTFGKLIFNDRDTSPSSRVFRFTYRKLCQKLLRISFLGNFMYSNNESYTGLTCASGLTLKFLLTTSPIIFIATIYISFEIRWYSVITEARISPVEIVQFCCLKCMYVQCICNILYIEVRCIASHDRKIRNAFGVPPITPYVKRIVAFEWMPIFWTFRAVISLFFSLFFSLYICDSDWRSQAIILIACFKTICPLSFNFFLFIKFTILYTYIFWHV